jgi:ATP-dependent DNA ligase
MVPERASPATGSLHNRRNRPSFLVVWTQVATFLEVIGFLPMAFVLQPSRTSPMEARIAEALPGGRGWQFEPKWDGFRCLAYKDAKRVALIAKSGKALTDYFPEITAAFARLAAPSFVVDGELVIPVGDALSFDALQMRLHPAESRRKRLAAETPALFILFDLLANAKLDFTGRKLTERRAALEELFSTFTRAGSFRLSPYTRQAATARRWLSLSGKGALDGVIAKPLDQPYLCGERAMLKVKNLKTADCVVGGFRYGTGSRQVGSLLLGLFRNDKLDHIGFTSGFSQLDRAALTRKLEAIKGGPGFSGNAPGGPSRWSTERSAQWVPVKNLLVAEVRYDHVTDGRFRHGTKFLRWRPDKDVRSCTFDQLQAEAPPSKIIAALFKD